ncbi:uncharacterized protein LOC133807072 [Humulus lupulus]|uniref:uncharacterized protein LOC133807072 n=1 Tax=Humulus lupulus TaxID=3486 RepID=UPI002B4158B1|nr:uncharacterized protein LOC133807072 [Humulus lupulus]
MLDGTNYACWNAQMRDFLKAMDGRVWSAVVDDWTPPTIKVGKTYSDSKLVRKMLIALPRKFKSKDTSIEEFHDVDTLDLDELIGSLQSYELTMKRWSKEKMERKVLVELSYLTELPKIFLWEILLRI